MKILLVDNTTVNIDRILNLLAHHDLDVIEHTDLQHVDPEKYDLVVLSGSSKTPQVELESRNFDVEKEWIKKITKPIIGICYGAELIAHVYGCKLVEKDKLRDIIHIEIIKDHAIFDGIYEYEVYESHRFYITELGEEIEGLAKSEGGYEIIKHKDKDIWGFQFHPEKYVEETTGDEIFLNLIEYLTFLTKKKSS